MYKITIERPDGKKLILIYSNPDKIVNAIYPDDCVKDSKGYIELVNFIYDGKTHE